MASARGAHPRSEQSGRAVYGGVCGKEHGLFWTLQVSRAEGSGGCRALQDFKEKFTERQCGRGNRDLLAGCWQRDATTLEGGNLGLEGVHKAVVVLTDFEAELSYLLSDRQQLIRSRAELALTHLQRSLAVDEPPQEVEQRVQEGRNRVRKSWEGCTACGTGFSASRSMRPAPGPT